MSGREQLIRMRNRTSVFDRIVLYLVAGAVVLGFLGFGAFDLLKGHSAPAKGADAAANAAPTSSPPGTSAPSAAPAGQSVNTQPGVVPVPSIPSGPPGTAGRPSTRGHSSSVTSYRSGPPKYVRRPSGKPGSSKPSSSVPSQQTTTTTKHPGNGKYQGNGKHQDNGRPAAGPGAKTRRAHPPRRRVTRARLQRRVHPPRDRIRAWPRPPFLSRHKRSPTPRAPPTRAVCHPTGWPRPQRLLRRLPGP